MGPGGVGEPQGEPSVCSIFLHFRPRKFVPADSPGPQACSPLCRGRSERSVRRFEAVAKGAGHEHLGSEGRHDEPDGSQRRRRRAQLRHPVGDSALPRGGRRRSWSRGASPHRTISDRELTLMQMSCDFICACVALPVSLLILSWLSSVPTNASSELMTNIKIDSLFPVAVILSLAFGGVYRVTHRQLQPSAVPGVPPTAGLRRRLRRRAGVGRGFLLPCDLRDGRADRHAARHGGLHHHRRHHARSRIVLRFFLHALTTTPGAGRRRAARRRSGS